MTRIDHTVIDKRTYDDSMVNLLALSTGFAANVGNKPVATDRYERRRYSWLY